MVFGDHLEPADSVLSAEWIGPGCSGVPGTVGALVPNHYESQIRLFPPAPSPEDWWPRYRELFDTVASVGKRHTSTPERAWFAIWDGHGFDRVTTHIAYRGPVDDESLRMLERRRAALRAEDQQRQASIASALAPIPRFALPDRDYYLLTGQVTAVTGLRYPNDNGWRNPDLFWPDDREWFVATDVDFWSLYVGGHDAFIRELTERVTTATEIVGYDFGLELED